MTDALAGSTTPLSGLTIGGRPIARFLSFWLGVGMIVASIMTIRHFFLANYPTSIYEGSFCDINAFFNCDSSAYSVISQVAGVPLGYFGLIVGALVALGALFPSPAVERTNKTIAFVNAIGIVGLFLFSVLYLGSLCLLCSGYYVCGLASFFLFWRYGIDRDARGFFARLGRFSWKHAVTYAVITAAGAYAMVLYHETRKEAQLGGVAAKVVKEYYSLPIVHAPSTVSPYWVTKATERFEEAPIRVVEYADFRCPDCLFLAQQIDKLKKEFAGKMNVAFQFFPLEAVCNTVVEKDLHPGACELAYIAAYDRGKFNAIYDDIWAAFQSGKSAEWRASLAKKYGVQAAAGDQATKDLVAKIINTGAEYEKTSAKFSHGIRSTPTMIINDRMVIGTLPYAQMQAIFRALVDEQATGPAKTFIENWEPRTKKK